MLKLICAISLNKIKIFRVTQCNHTASIYDTSTYCTNRKLNLKYFFYHLLIFCCISKYSAIQWNVNTCTMVNKDLQYTIRYASNFMWKRKYSQCSGTLNTVTVDSHNRTTEFRWRGYTQHLDFSLTSCHMVTCALYNILAFISKRYFKY